MNVKNDKKEDLITEIYNQKKYSLSKSILNELLQIDIINSKKLFDSLNKRGDYKIDRSNYWKTLRRLDKSELLHLEKQEGEFYLITIDQDVKQFIDQNKLFLKEISILDLAQEIEQLKERINKLEMLLPK